MEFKMVENKNFKHLDTITALFVSVLIISNIASSKIVKIWLFEFDGGTIIFHCLIFLVIFLLKYMDLKDQEKLYG